MRYLLAVLLFAPSFSMAAPKTARVSCDTRIKDVQDEFTGKVQALEKEKAALEEKVKTLEDTIAMCKGEKRFIGSEGYEKAKWGMSSKEVLALYPSKNVTAGVIKLESTVAEIPATVEFIFSGQDQLSSVRVDFRDADLFSHTINSTKVSKYLVEKHGKPNAGEAAKDTEKEGAVTQENWDTGKTYISHVSIVKASSIKHFMVYTSAELENQE